MLAAAFFTGGMALYAAAATVLSITGELSAAAVLTYMGACLGASTTVVALLIAKLA